MLTGRLLLAEQRIAPLARAQAPPGHRRVARVVEIALAVDGQA
jgi:hypothetical protein